MHSRLTIVACLSLSAIMAGAANGDDRDGRLDGRLDERLVFDQTRSGPTVVCQDGDVTAPLGGYGVAPGCLPQFDEVLLVNGVQTDPETAIDEAIRAGNRLGAGVRLIYNETTCPLLDILMAIWDKIAAPHLALNGATDVLLDEIRLRIADNQTVHVIGYSEGAICVSNAIEAYADELLEDASIGPAERARRLARIHVLTVGSAVLDDGDLFADAWPTDLASVFHLYHEDDLVANLLGPGRIRNIFNGFIGHHDFIETYVPALDASMLMESGRLELE